MTWFMTVSTVNNDAISLERLSVPKAASWIPLCYCSFARWPKYESASCICLAYFTSLVSLKVCPLNEWMCIYIPHRSHHVSWRFTILFSVFMWRNHIPKFNFTFPSQVLVSSGKRPYSNLTYHNVSARQGSSYCNRVRLNFQAFALRDMKIGIREGCRLGQKMSYHFSFC